MLRQLRQSFATLTLALCGYALAGCDNFSFKAEPEEGATSSFGGIKSISITPDGKYVLLWDLATTSDVNSVSYEVSMDKWTSIPSDVSADAVGLGSTPEVTLGARFATMPDSTAPVTKGVMLGSVRGARSYTLDEKLLPHVIYAFQVRMVDADGKRDANQQILIYSADFNSITFNGISSLAINPTGKTILSWSAPADLPAGIKVADVSYDIYMQSTPDSLDVVIAGATVLGGGSSLALTTSATQAGTLAEMEEEKLPSSNVAPLAQNQTGTFYRLDDALEPGMTYIFQVLAHGPAQESGFSKRVVIYRPEALSFTGLKTENVTVATDGSKITLKWDAATGTAGAISYVVYSDANFQTAIATTSATTYEFMNPVKGRAYTFAVRAKDGSMLDSNKEFVVISVPDPSDKTPPEFAGLVSATVASDKKIVLKWDASASVDIAGYNIYNAFNLTQPIASTVDTSFAVGGLTPAMSYSFIVRAKDTSGNEDKNSVQKSATTLAYSVPDFAGITGVERLGGEGGLSMLKVTWQPAGGTVTGYKVYMASTSGAEDFTNPVTTLADANATQTIVTGLTGATSYYFIVRAYDSSSGTARSEQNVIEKTNSTLAVKAPTFAGISAATPGAGALAFTTIKATWPAPQTDGVYDGFVVQYEAGTCAAGFSGSPTEVQVSGDSNRDYTVTGLTAQTTYRLRVRARYSVTNTVDANTTCKEAYTSPAAPTFSGISSLAIASGSAGFSSLIATWPAATGSFSYYKVEWSTSQAFTAIGGSSQVSDINTLTKTVTGLPAKTLVYVRVSAVFDESGVQLASGSSKSLSANTTPIAPTGEAVSTVSVMSADSLKVAWTAPTNAVSALFNGYKLWSYCGANAPTNLLAKLSGAADQNYAAGQLNATFTGLASNTECCYQVRAYYDDGVSTLSSNSNATYKCKTPTLTAPTFAGVTSVTNNNQASGFGQLTVNWNAVDASEAGLFSYYEIAWATTPSGQVWTSGTQTVNDRTTTNKVITGLTENTTYYFRVRAVNNNGSPSVSNGTDAVASAKTTPKTPTGDNLSAATSIGSTKARLTYAPPNSDASVGGLVNNVFLFIQAGSAGDVTSYRNGIESGGVANAEVQGTLNAGKITLSAVPALVKVPPTEIVNDQNNTYDIFGLSPNVQVCVQAVAVYWVDGQPTKYLTSTTPTTRCVTPTAGAPAFSGVTSLSGFDDSRDFTQIKVNWGSITGDCTSVEISATTTPDTPNFASPKGTATCSDSTVTLGSLTPHADYYIQVRAVNEVGGQFYYAGQGTELMRTTRPTTPSGDGMVSTTANAVAKAPDTMSLVYTEATAGLWNKTYIWRGTAATLSAAQSAVQAAAATKVDHSGPTSAPYFTKTSGSTTANDTSVTAGTYACYLARAVYDDGSYYNASASDTIKCDRPAYTTPVFTGVSSAAITGTWPDGTAKIELTFGSTPVGSIEEYWVYYSPTGTLGSFGDLTAEPWQKIDVGDATYDANANDAKILVGGVGRTVAGPGYFLVRYKFYYGLDSDTNTAISNSVTVSSSESNLAYVPPSFSGLGYGYYIMQYEASVASGSYDVGDSVTATESNLATCNYKFHNNKTALDTSCGTRTSTTTVKSAKDAAPTSANWHQAYMACRGSGSSGVLMRLPTAEEWRRAAKWVGTSYGSMWTVYASGTAGNCNISSGSTANAGSAANCKNSLSIFDMAGNQSEWVDSRMVRYSIDDPLGDGTGGGFDTDSERRFSYGPTIGRTLKNGIDNVSRRFHLMDPGASGLTLALGADAVTPATADYKQYGTDVQSWLAPSTAGATNGFRCVALSAAQMPTMAHLALPDEPVYTTSDYSGAASTWTIPENFYAKDVRPETVAINITGAADAVAEGNVAITWMPWSTTTCTPSCSSSTSNMTYKVYRFVEPTLFSNRLTTLWAITGGPNPYSSDTPLDPLAVDGSGNALFTTSTTAGRLLTTITDCDSVSPANCTFTDSESAGTGFSTRKLYDYVVVAESASGTRQPATVQRWLTPYLAGGPVTSGASTFRVEQRMRRASVFLVDEAYQQAQSSPQIMVHVPMDLSGLDHDFFIHKYEASSASGSVTNNDPSGAGGSPEWPLQADATGGWKSNAAKCYDSLAQTGSFSATNCGNGTTSNTTSTIVRSKQGTAPLVSIDQGAFWKACRNTGIADDDSNSYYLSLPTDAEWMKAADWGDLNLNGTIDVNPVASIVGTSAAAVENGAADAVTVRCHTDNNPGSAYNSNDANTAKCRSRYGAADMVGNVWEWTTGQIYNGVGYDNGVDGLWMNQNFPTASSAILAIGGGSSAKYDLFRGLPKASGAPSLVDNGDYYWYNSALVGAVRGGVWDSMGHSGRWTLLLGYVPSGRGVHIGGRCRR